MLNITNIIIVVNIAMFFMQQYFLDMSIIFGMNYLFIEQDFLFQPLSSMFLHGSLMHLAMNMVVLFQFGTLIEKNIGKKFFIFTYILGGILTSILSLFFMIYFDRYANMIGASGGISVLLGVFAVFNKSYKGLLLAILIMSFAPILMGINVAWYAHLIGFFIGSVIAVISLAIFKKGY